VSSAAPSHSTNSELSAPDPNRWRALVVIAIAQLMVVLDASIVNIALPSMQEDLGRYGLHARIRWFTFAWWSDC